VGEIYDTPYAFYVTQSESSLTLEIDTVVMEMVASDFIE
jgi:hypothetical protein